MAEIACGGSGTCTLVITPYVATADDYEALTVIFIAIFTAACIIWGVKAVLNLLRDRPDS